MGETRWRRGGTISGSLMTAGLAILLLLTACQTGPAPSPSAQAVDPTQVLFQYLRALATGDCALARTYATADFGDGHYCGGALHVTGFDIKPSPADLGGEMVFALTLWTRGGDETMPDGSHTWFFQLKRQPDDRWLVSDGGSGP